MEKITSLISEKENILLLLSCLASVVAAFLSLISVRNTIKASNTLKRRIRKQYINQYIHRYSKVTEDELDRKLAIILAEIDSNIEKALKNKDIEYSKEQLNHVKIVIKAMEEISRKRQNNHYRNLSGSFIEARHRASASSTTLRCVAVMSFS